MRIFKSYLYKYLLIHLACSTYVYILFATLALYVCCRFTCHACKYIYALLLALGMLSLYILFATLVFTCKYVAFYLPCLQIHLCVSTCIICMLSLYLSCLQIHLQDFTPANIVYSCCLRIYKENMHACCTSFTYISIMYYVQLCSSGKTNVAQSQPMK